MGGNHTSQFHAVVILSEGPTSPLQPEALPVFTAPEEASGPNPALKLREPQEQPLKARPHPSQHAQAQPPAAHPGQRKPGSPYRSAVSYRRAAPYTAPPA